MRINHDVVISNSDIKGAPLRVFASGYLGETIYSLDWSVRCCGDLRRLEPNTILFVLAESWDEDELLGTYVYTLQYCDPAGNWHDIGPIYPFIQVMDLESYGPELFCDCGDSIDINGADRCSRCLLSEASENFELASLSARPGARRALAVVARK